MVPSAFIINREGLMEGIIVGQREWCGPTFEAALKERMTKNAGSLTNTTIFV
jgi:hypothetical protein